MAVFILLGNTMPFVSSDCLDNWSIGAFAPHQWIEALEGGSLVFFRVLIKLHIYPLRIPWHEWLVVFDFQSSNK